MNVRRPGGKAIFKRCLEKPFPGILKPTICNNFFCSFSALFSYKKAYSKCICVSLMKLYFIFFFPRRGKCYAGYTYTGYTFLLHGLVKSMGNWLSWKWTKLLSNWSIPSLKKQSGCCTLYRTSSLYTLFSTFWISRTSYHSPHLQQLDWIIIDYS